MSIAEYKLKLQNCATKNSESAFQKVADQFEDDLLEYRDIPNEYFYFFIELLSSKNIYEKPGLWNFLLVMGTEGHKLHEKHYSEIAKTIVSNYACYLNGDLSLSVCDFIARNYPHKEAKELLLCLREIESEDDNLPKSADEGLRILQNEIDRASK